MLHPLIFLSALSLLSGADAQETINSTSVVNVSSCPFVFYGETYEQLYVNISADRFSICGNGYYQPGTKGNCIVGPPIQNPTVNFEKVIVGAYEPFISQQLPNIQTPLECYLAFSIQSNGSGIIFALLNMGRQTVLYLKSFSFGSWVYDVQLNGVTVDHLNVTITESSWQVSTVIDVSGCKHSGVLYKHGSVVSYDPKTCTKLICNDTAVLQNISTSCESLHNNTTDSLTNRTNETEHSMLDLTCTVTGPTVIDFYGQVNSVQDRCAYSLLSVSSVPNFSLLANFQERRRKDVSFVDSVTLMLDGSGVLHLEQGGVVQLNNATLTLNSSTQLVQGVELSKDQTGVTAKVALSNYSASVFFDGYTAQIHLTGPAGVDPSHLSGLCGKSSVAHSEVRLSDYSVSGCEDLYSDTTDSSINCTKMTERCNVLNQAPFTTCNSLIDPEPYVTACINTMCKYPSVDQLYCQFLDSYARACSLQSNLTVGDWWTMTDCSPPQAFCQDRTCSDHEFCGETIAGETGCFCRALFADSYRSTGALGDPTVCRHNSASLTLVGCLLEEKNIDYTSLHLNDQTCRGQMDELTHMVTFSFDTSNSCGAVIMNNNSQIMYKNTITAQNNQSDIIVHQDQVYIDFSCFYTQPDINSLSFRLKTSSVVQHITSGPWNYTLTMKSYTDAHRTKPVEYNTDVLLDQKIWVELKTDGLDCSMVAVVTDSCWATADPSPSANLRYDLITNGCANPADQTVKVQRNGLGTSNYFSFNMFQFYGQSDGLYLHCKVQLCLSGNNSCAPVCNRPVRKRRYARTRPKYEEEAAAFISMAWTS